MPRKFSMHVPDDLDVILKRLEANRKKSAAGVVSEAVEWFDVCDTATAGSRVSALIVTFPNGQEVRCEIPEPDGASKKE